MQTYLRFTTPSAAPLCPLPALAGSTNGTCPLPSCTELDLHSCPTTSLATTPAITSWASKACLAQLCTAYRTRGDAGVCPADKDKLGQYWTELTGSPTFTSQLKSGFGTGTFRWGSGRRGGRVPVPVSVEAVVVVDVSVGVVAGNQAVGSSRVASQRLPTCRGLLPSHYYIVIVIILYCYNIIIILIC